MPDVQAALRHLEARGFVTLPGAPSRAMSGWPQVRRRALTASLAALGLGAALIVAGVALRAVDAWALLGVLGGLVALGGGGAALVSALVAKAHRYRHDAEGEPVHLDARGVTMRGVGPIPWHDVLPPAYDLVRTKNDVRGSLPLMPLTPAGRAAVAAMPFRSQLLVGPKRYLRSQVRDLLLPGVAGLSEAEVVDLFREAHARWAVPWGPRSS